MTVLIDKTKLMEHVIDALVGDTYEEVVLLEDIYEAPMVQKKEEDDDMTTSIAFAIGLVGGFIFGVIVGAVLTAERWK